MNTLPDNVKKPLRASQLHIYAIALLLTGAVSELVWTVFNAVHRNTELPFTMLYTLLLLAGAWLLYRRFKRGEAEVHPADDICL